MACGKSDTQNSNIIITIVVDSKLKCRIQKKRKTTAHRWGQHTMYYTNRNQQTWYTITLCIIYFLLFSEGKTKQKQKKQRPGVNHSFTEWNQIMKCFNHTDFLKAIIIIWTGKKREREGTQVYVSVKNANVCVSEKKKKLGKTSQIIASQSTAEHSEYNTQQKLENKSSSE